MVNEGLIACIEKHEPKEVAEALIHSYMSSDLQKIVNSLQDYLDNYNTEK